MKTFGGIMVAVALILAAFLVGRITKPCHAAVNRIDTLVVRDTVHDTVLVPRISLLVRIDTVFVRVAGDTVRINAQLPIEQKIYHTDDYRAVVEGFRPALVQMELYRNTLHINRETVVAPLRSQNRRWGIGLHAGYGITPKGGTPYIGIGVQYNLIMW